MTRGIVGREGMEVRRFCGASSLSTEETDKNMLAGMCLLPNSLSRTSQASIVVRGQDQYHVLYHRAVVTEDDCPITHVNYSVSHDGGEFFLPPLIVFHCPLLGEAVYKKMMSVIAVVA